jgi:hypothetical protein
MHFTHFTTVSFKYWFKDKLLSNISHTKLKECHPPCVVKITIAVCVYVSNTTIFIGSILNCYVRYNYLFRPYLLSIFRLYNENLSSIYTIICGLLSGGEWLCRCEISVWQGGMETMM